MAQILNTKLIAKNTIFLYMRMGVSMLVSIYVARIILEQLGETNYGIYNVIGGVVAMFISFNSALSFGTQRFINYYMGLGEPDKLKRVFSSSFRIHFIFAIILTTLMESIGLWFVNNVLVIPPERMAAANIIYQITIFSTFVTIIQIPFTALILAHERMNIYAYMSILEVALRLFIALSLSRAPFDVLVYYVGMGAISSIIQIMIYMLYCRKSFSECSIQKYSETDKELYHSIIKYSGWNLFGTVGFMVSDQGLNMLLNVMYGPAINAARGISMQIKQAVNSFSSSIQTAFNPQIVKLYASEQLAEMHDLICKNIKYCLALITLLVVPLIVEMDYILDIWLKNPPQYTSIFCRIILLKLFLSCFESPFGTANGATGNNKIYTIVSSVYLVSTLPFAYIAIKLFDAPYYAFVAEILVYMAMIIWKVFYIKKQIQLSPIALMKKCIMPTFVVLVLSSISAIAVHYILPSSFIRLVMVCGASVLVSIAADWYLIFDQQVKSFILQKLHIQRIIQA